MKLKDILLKVGSAAIRSAVPGGGVILDVINSFLPDSKKLNKNVTGEQASVAINALPPHIKLSIMEKELDVEVASIQAWAQIQASLASADMSGASTRPKIAIMMARFIGFAIIVFMSMWSVAILRDQQDMIKNLTDFWPVLLAILATPTALLRAYFGMRTKEKQSRYQAATGQAQPGNILLDMIKAVKND